MALALRALPLKLVRAIAPALALLAPARLLDTTAAATDADVAEAGWPQLKLCGEGTLASPLDGDSSCQGHVQVCVAVEDRYTSHSGCWPPGPARSPPAYTIL